MISKYFDILYMLIVKLQLTLPLLIITSIVCLIIIIRMPITYAIKIERFWLTYLAALIYLSFYILMFLILKVLYINRHIDLKRYYYLFEIINAYPLYWKIMYILIGIGLLLIWILIFLKFRKFLSWKCWQLHIYWRSLSHVYVFQHLSFRDNCVHTIFSSKQVKISEFYDNFVDGFLYNYSLIRVISRFHFRLIVPIKKFFLNTKPPYTLNVALYAIPLRYITLGLLIGIFIYECLWNNWVLHYTVYYLLFYMIFVILYRITFILWHDVSPFVRAIIFERAYCEPEVYFVNLTKRDELELENYIHKSHDQTYLTPPDDFPYGESLQDHPINVNNRFSKTKKLDQKLWLDDEPFRQADEYIWCNHAKSPIKMFWFNEKDIKIIKDKKFVKEREQSKLLRPE